MTTSAAARLVLERADELAGFTEEPGRITRPLASPSLAQAMGRLREWMEAAGMETRSDALGNLVGRRGGGPALMIGSHLDSVADAGRYDGILGVLVGLAVVEALDEDVPVELVAFADEEGLRFQSTFLGSRAFVGKLEADELELRDPDGVTLGEAIEGPLGEPLFDGARAYFEVHIEQGPVLEAAGLPLGVVTAIAGQTRFNLAFEGHAGHAGTTPMDLRRDALGAAAEFVLAAERLANDTPGLVATVGEIGIPHGACNVIPGRVEATLDIRHQDDAVRERAIATLREQTDQICERRRDHRELVADRRARRDAVHAGARRAPGRGGRRDRRRGPRAAERRRPRCGHDGRRDRHRDAVRPQRRRHQPPPGRVRRGGRRGAGDRGRDPLRHRARPRRGGA